jgi:hypothetical protein
VGGGTARDWGMLSRIAVGSAGRGPRQRLQVPGRLMVRPAHTLTSENALLALDPVLGGLWPSDGAWGTTRAMDSSCAGVEAANSVQDRR